MITETPDPVPRPFHDTHMITETPDPLVSYMHYDNIYTYMQGGLLAVLLELASPSRVGAVCNILHCSMLYHIYIMLYHITNIHMYVQMHSIIICIVYIYIYIYIYTHIYIYIYTYIFICGYIYIYREREIYI